MTNFIPVFPLGIVVYPGEQLNLHIFEPRYKQLIIECQAAGKPFGIPSVIDNKVKEYGSLVHIREISKLYDNGEMDIRTEGDRVFRVLEMIREIPDKLYSGAIVNYPHNRREGSPGLMQKLLGNVKDLYALLKIKKEFKKAPEELTSYDIAHHLGLSLEEEYELLGLFDERQRQEYLRRFLVKAMPLVSGIEQLKEKIRLNGHFKDLEGFDLRK